MDMLQGNLSPAAPGGDSTDGYTDENEQLQKPLEETPCPSGPPIDHYQPSGQRLTKKELLDRLSYASQKAWSSVRKRSMVPLPLPAATERRMRQWFELVDGDGSGHLSASEVEFALRATGINANANTIAEVIKQLSSARNPLGEDYVLPSGVALPIGSMIDALRRRKILEDVQKGGMHREFWAAEGQEFLRYLLETEKYDFDDESRETIRRILEYKPPAVKEGEFALSPKAAEEHKRRIERLKLALLRNAGGGGGGGGGSAQRRASSTTRSRIHSAVGGSAAATIGPSGGRRSLDVTALPMRGGIGGAGGSSRAGSSRASRILRAADVQRRGTVDGALPSSLAAAGAAAEGSAAAANVMSEEDSESGGSFRWIAIAEENLAARVRFCSPTLAQGLILAGLDRSGEGTDTDTPASASASASASTSPRYKRHPSSSCCTSSRTNPKSAPPSTTTSRTALPDGSVDVGVYLGRVSGGGAAATATTTAAAANGGVWSATASAAASGSTRPDVGARASGFNDTYDISGWATTSTRRPVLGPARGQSPFSLQGTGGGHRGGGAGGPRGLNERMRVAKESSERGALVARACASARNDGGGVGLGGEESIGEGNGEEHHDHTACHGHDDDEEEANEEVVVVEEEEEEEEWYDHDGVLLSEHAAALSPTPPTPTPVAEATLSCITTAAATASPTSVPTLAAPPGLLQRRPMPTGPYTNRMLRAIQGSRQGALSPTLAAAATCGSGMSLDGSILTASAASTASAAVAVGFGATGFRSESYSTGTGSEASSAAPRNLPAVTSPSSRTNFPCSPTGNVSAAGGAVVGAVGAVGAVGLLVNGATGPGSVANSASVSSNFPCSATSIRDPGSSQTSALEASARRRAEAARMMGSGRADKMAAEIRRNVRESAQHIQQQQQQTNGSWSPSGLACRTTTSNGGHAAPPHMAPGSHASDPALLLNVVDLVGFEQWRAPAPPQQHAVVSCTANTSRTTVTGVGMVGGGFSSMGPRCGSGSGSGSFSGGAPAAAAAAVRAFPGSEKYDMGLKPTQVSSYAPSFSSSNAIRSLSPVSAIPRSGVAPTAPTRTGGAAGSHTGMAPSPPLSPTVLLPAAAAERSTAGGGGYSVSGGFVRDGRPLTGRRSLDSEPRAAAWRIASAGRALSPSPGAIGGSQSQGHIPGNPSRLQPWGRGQGVLHHSHHQLLQQQQVQQLQQQQQQQLQQQQQMDSAAAVVDLRAASFPSAAASPGGFFQMDRPFLAGSSGSGSGVAATAGTAGATAGTPTTTGGAFASSATAAANAAASANAGVAGSAKRAAAGDGKKWPWPWKREIVAAEGAVGSMAAKRSGSGGAGVGGGGGQNQDGGDGVGGVGVGVGGAVSTSSAPAMRVRSSFMKWS
ncbi:hypothetical protein VaNZ11_008094 [Volvox africanus]|uniref:EF-hand domain-containing protein n=1 Tax=Volvox africanus TaxID=51714 RepID=A0ABQ5S4A5_9CHLO|nr:hypothetical protein VaNZ11_008094 [Volvox africanus]